MHLLYSMKVVHVYDIAVWSVSGSGKAAHRQRGFRVGRPHIANRFGKEQVIRLHDSHAVMSCMFCHVCSCVIVSLPRIRAIVMRNSVKSSQGFRKNRTPGAC